ncbi:MAG TPA: hypothetical protein VM450_00520 [Thermomicrobiales bacterium]|nr:hypothetical protein [Thermomicrobiales bacterium]
MTDSQAQATQADADATSQADDLTDQTQASGQASEPTTIDALPKWAQDEIKGLRKEAGKYRTRVQEFEDAAKTEDEKRTEALKAAEDRAAAAESRYRAAIGRAAVSDAATKAGAISAKAVYALIRDDIAFDDTGEPTNIEALITQARKDEPQLFRAANGSGDGGKGGGATAKPSLNDLIRAGLQQAG